MADITPPQLRLGPCHVSVAPNPNSPGILKCNLETANCSNRIPWAKHCRLTIISILFFDYHLIILQEFKIFEIASACTDAMTNNLRAWTFPQNARDILNHLHRILTSCRGGNVILSAMLRSKIAQIQDNQPLLLQPSTQVRDFIQPNRGGTPVGFSFELDGSLGSASEVPESEQNDDEVFEVGGDGIGEPNLNCSEDQLQMASHAARLSWSSTGEGTSTILANSWDLYEQLQSIDGPFNGFEAFDFWDSLTTNEDLAQSSVGCGFANLLPPSPVSAAPRFTVQHKM